MTNAEAARSKRPTEELHDPIVLLHKLNAVSDSMTSSITGNGDVVNNAACLSNNTLACDKPNKIIAADNLDVQVFAAMRKA